MLAPWRSPLAHALHRNRALVNARYLQLATVRADGRPANRTVVFRGFRDDSNDLLLVTDQRSEKITQIAQQPWGEICWYFPKTREQFRLAGALLVVTTETSTPELQPFRASVWRSLSDNARLQFAWPQPGVARSTPDPDFNPPLPDPEVPLPTFCLLLLQPVWVDHLELRGQPQNRQQYHCTGQDWVSQAVNP